MANNFLDIKGSVEILNKELNKHAEIIDRLVTSYKGLKLPSDYLKAQKTQLKNQKDLEASTKKLAQTEEKLKKALEKITQANERNKTAIIKTAEAQEKLNQTRIKGASISKQNSEKEVQANERTKKSIIATSSAEERLNQTKKRGLDQDAKRRVAKAKSIANNKKLASAWSQLNAKLQKAELRFKNLAVSQGLSNKQTIKAQKEVLKLRARVDSVNVSVKRFNGNVGNYRSAFKGLGSSVRGFMGAFGAVGGIYLFASAIRNTFNRIREFDKAMQNIAGITRTTRKDLKDLEKEIIKVAGSSIKTSNEVAKLAENLFTLGKSKEDVKLLLKPVNDLAIGLETTSGEAAEFLVQTLNAFGASSSEASKYADTIATIRTSTSLDFQKMRDSFQYLTPISRLLNKDLAYTGSVLGILADNGLKAESAGRLLGTAQQKLAKSGKTLQNALDEINEAQEKGIKGVELLALGSDLFGKQAAKVGIILANNTDIIEKNAQAIRDNGGALKDLTDRQLESLDAKLKILDSTWESFILHVSNGEGAIGSFFKTMIVGLTDAIEGMRLLSIGSQGREGELLLKLTDSGQAAEVKNLNDLVKLSGKTIEEEAKQNKIYTEEKIAGLKAQISINKEILAQEGKIFDGSLNVQERSKLNKEVIKAKESEVELTRSMAFLTGELSAQNLVLKDSTDGNSGANNNLGKSVIKNVQYYKDLIAEQKKLLPLTTNRDEAKAIQGKIKAFQSEIDAILGIEKASKRVKEKAIGLNFKEASSITFLEQAYIDMLKPLSKTSDEYKKIDKILKSLRGIQEAENLMLDEGYKKRIKKAESIKFEKERLEELQLATENFIQGVSESALGNLGLGSLTTFFDGTFKTLFDNADELGEKFAVTFNAIGEVAKEAFAIIGQASQQNFDNQFTQLEIQKEVAIQFAGDSTSAKEEIERQYEEKRKVIQRKQAEAQKKQALFNIITSTAQGVVSALATLNIPLSIAIGVIGAAQAAMVASSPIPEFKDGVTDFGGGMAIVGDGGKHEYIKTPDGTVSKTPNTNTLVNLPKGSDVYKDENSFLSNLYKELNLNDIMPFSNTIGQSVMPNVTSSGISKEDLREVFSNELNKLNNTIKNKTETSLNIDENGWNVSTYKNGQKRKILNSRVRGNSTRA